VVVYVNVVRLLVVKDVVVAVVVVVTVTIAPLIVLAGRKIMMRLMDAHKIKSFILLNPHESPLEFLWAVSILRREGGHLFDDRNKSPRKHTDIGSI